MQNFIQVLLENSLKASVVVVLVILLNMFLSKWISARWRCCLWLLVMLRLLMPPVLPSEFSAFNIVNVIQDAFHYKTAETLPITDSRAEVAEVFEIKGASGRNFSTPKIKKSVDVGVLLFGIWAVATLGFLSLVLWKNFSLLVKVRQERLLTNSALLELLEDCRKEMGIHTIVNLIETRHVESPALMGLIRPRLLIPAGMSKAISHEDLRYVFIHELSHLKNLDIFINWFAAYIQVIHWFNPFVWYAMAKMRVEREYACDERVLAFINPSERKTYGRTLINFTDLYASNDVVTGIMGISENKKQIKRRLQMISEFKNKSLWSAAFATAVMIIIASCCLTDQVKPEATKKENNTKTSIKDTNRLLAEDYEFISGDLVLKNAEISRNGEFLKGDKIVLRNDGKKSMHATGNVTLRFKTSGEEKDSGIEKKLQEIVFDHMEFENVAIYTVVKYLNSRSQELDPEKQGVNILLRLSPQKAAHIPTISMMVDDIPLGEAIKYICKASGLKYAIEENAVVITSQDILELETRLYPQEVFAKLGGGAGDAIEKFFIDRGIPFPQGADIVFESRTGRLIVTNTPDNLSRIETIVRALDAALPNQVKPEKSKPEAAKGEDSVKFSAEKKKALTGIQKKLREIIIDHMEFEEVTIYTVVKYLMTRSKELDPEKQGVNILLQLSATDDADLPTLTMSVDNIPLGEAIEYICSGAGLRYVVEEEAVVIILEVVDAFEPR